MEENKKYKHFYDNKNYFFVDETVDFKKDTQIIIIIDNTIKKYSDKLEIINYIFLSHKILNCCITVISLFPYLKVYKIKSLDDLLGIFCNMKYIYKKSTGKVIFPDQDLLFSVIKENIISIKYLDNCNDIFIGFCNSNVYEKIISNFNKETKKLFPLFFPHEHFKQEDHENIIKSIRTDKENIKMIRKSTSLTELIYTHYNILMSLTKTNYDETDFFVIKKVFDEFIEIIEINKNNNYKFLIDLCKEWIHWAKIRNMSTQSSYSSYLENYNICSISYKKYQKIIRNLTIIDVKELENKINHISQNLSEIITNIKSDDSFYFSKFSLSGWKEEIEEKSCLGILMSVHVENYNKSGDWIDDIFFTNKTKLFLSVVDYLNILNSKATFNGDVMSLGIENLLLPVYINKYHWKIAKCHVSMMLGLSICGNVSLYSKKMDNIYYLVAVEYFKSFVNSVECNDLIKYFKLWVSILRTCIELSKEKGYHKGINKYCEMLTSKKQIQVNVLFGQLMSTGKIISKNGTSLGEKKINEYISQNGTNYDHCYKALKLVDCFKCKAGGFKKFINLIDSNNGCLPKDYEDIAIKFTKGIL